MLCPQRDYRQALDRAVWDSGDFKPQVMGPMLRRCESGWRWGPQSTSRWHSAMYSCRPQLPGALPGPQRAWLPDGPHCPQGITRGAVGSDSGWHWSESSLVLRVVISVFLVTVVDLV